MGNLAYIYAHTNNFKQIDIYYISLRALMLLYFPSGSCVFFDLPVMWIPLITWHNVGLRWKACYMVHLSIRSVGKSYKCNVNTLLAWAQQPTASMCRLCCGMPRHQGINNANDWTNLHCTTPDFSLPKKSVSGVTSKSREFRIGSTNTFLWSTPNKHRKLPSYPDFVKNLALNHFFKLVNIHPYFRPSHQQTSMA